MVGIGVVGSDLDAGFCNQFPNVYFKVHVSFQRSQQVCGESLLSLQIMPHGSSLCLLNKFRTTLLLLDYANELYHFVSTRTLPVQTDFVDRLMSTAESKHPAHLTDSLLNQSERRHVVPERSFRVSLAWPHVGRVRSLGSAVSEGC